MNDELPDTAQHLTGQVALDRHALPRGATISVELITQPEQDYSQITTFIVIPS